MYIYIYIDNYIYIYLETLVPIIGEVCKNPSDMHWSPNVYWMLDKRPQVQLLCMERKERFEDARDELYSAGYYLADHAEVFCAPRVGWSWLIMVL